MEIVLENIGSINDLISYVYHEKYGYADELQQAIGKQAVRKLELMGYIENAPHPSGRTWKATSRCKRFGDSHKEKRGLVSKVFNMLYARKLRLNSI